MKKILSATVLVLALLPASIHAGDISKGAGASGQKAATLDVQLELGAVFPTLPDAPRFTAKGAGALGYHIQGQQAIIDAGSIPAMTFTSEGPIGDIGQLTVAVAAIPGTSPVVDWSRFPRIVLKSVDLRIQAYDGPASAGAKPFLDITLGDLSLATDQIVVEGIEAQGFVDAERAEAQIVVSALLPEYPFPIYAEWLAGEPVILELRVGMANPFGK